MAPTARVLTASADDVALGTALVVEYIEATIADSEAYGEPLPRAVTPMLFPEVSDFRAVYRPPGAAYLVTEVAGEVAAGVGVMPLDGAARTCEMKRLWVRPPYRGAGVARALCVALLDEARRLDYGRMVLDVMPQRTVAIALYRSLGFTDSVPTHEYPFSMIFLARAL